MQHRRTEFIKLLIASFISQSGSHFLTIALAGFVFLRSGSIIKASLIFILSYLPSILVSAWIGDYIDRRLSRWLLACSDIFSIIISFLCGVCIALELPLALLCVLITLRSLLLFTARAGGIKWIKLITPPELQSSRIKFFFLSFFLSTATAGILAALALKQPSIRIVVLVDIGTYILGICVILALHELPDTGNPIGTNGTKFSTLTSLREILKQSDLAPYFISVCLSQAIFQGAYSVFVSYLPINRFQLGVQGLGTFQIAASLGIIVGFLVLWMFPNVLANRYHSLPTPLLATLGVGVLGLLSCVTVRVLPVSLVSFFLVNTAYECVWLFSSSEFFRNSSPESIGRYQFVLTSSASCIMAIFTLCYAILIEIFSLQIGTAIIVITGLLIWGYISYLSALHKRNFIAEELTHE
jgi:hypothetical protein